MNEGCKLTVRVHFNVRLRFLPCDTLNNQSIMQIQYSSMHEVVKGELTVSDSECLAKSH
jgi:hypothetical protein